MKQITQIFSEGENPTLTMKQEIVGLSFPCSKAYSEPCETSKIESFAKDCLTGL